MNLMRCLREMLNHQPKKRGAKQGAGVVPFRESKLTHMFMNHLTGPSASRTSMIVNVNPAADDFDETQHVLSYATTARSVKVSMVDYNKKHRILAKESNVKLSPLKKIKELVKKFSPQKRKGTDLNNSKPASKRPRNDAAATKRAGGPVVTKKILPARPASGRSQRDVLDEVEKLREENFTLKITVDDLEQQLADCESEVRKEVVEIMTEQLEDSKEWYESRIESLKQQLKSLHTSNSKQVKGDSDAQSRVNELYERINECEEEMTRMREEHEAEKAKELLNLTNLQVAELEVNALAHEDELRAEREEKEKLLMENGALKHQSEELRASHDALLAKYNELVARLQRDSPDTFDSIDPEPTCELFSPNYHKLPRERCSNVASIAAPEDIKSPKSNGKKWGFLRSPAKVAAGQKDNRSPLGDVNRTDS